MAHAEGRGDGFRARYKRPDGSRGSQSGFTSETAAKNWGNDQESLIRRNTWIDPRDAETPFGDFAEEYLTAISPRLGEGTAAKYRSHLDSQLLPQWSAWPMIGIFNSYIEIEKWVSELHEDYAESTVSSFFATFSTFLNAAVRARIIPASPVQRYPGHVRRLCARAARGLPGAGAIGIQVPLKEVGGVLKKYGKAAAETDAVVPAPSSRPSSAAGRKGRTKTPAGTRWVELPPSLAVFFELLLGSHSYPFVAPRWRGIHGGGPASASGRTAFPRWLAGRGWDRR